MLGSAISFSENASDEMNFAKIKSYIFPVIMNITIYKQFKIFPKIALFFLPKNSTIIFAGI